jgi:hypothetical protein
MAFFGVKLALKYDLAPFSEISNFKEHVDFGEEACFQKPPLLGMH